MKTALPAVLGSIDNRALVQAAEDRFSFRHSVISSSCILDLGFYTL